MRALAPASHPQEKWLKNVLNCKSGGNMLTSELPDSSMSAVRTKWQWIERWQHAGLLDMEWYGFRMQCITAINCITYRMCYEEDFGNFCHLILFSIFFLKEKYFKTDHGLIKKTWWYSCFNLWLYIILGRFLCLFLNIYVWKLNPTAFSFSLYLDKRLINLSIILLAISIVQFHIICAGMS